MEFKAKTKEMKVPNPKGEESEGKIGVLNEFKDLCMAEEVMSEKTLQVDLSHLQGEQEKELEAIDVVTGLVSSTIPQFP